MHNYKQLLAAWRLTDNNIVRRHKNYSHLLSALDIFNVTLLPADVPLLRNIQWKTRYVHSVLSNTHNLVNSYCFAGVLVLNRIDNRRPSGEVTCPSSTCFFLGVVFFGVVWRFTSSEASLSSSFDSFTEVWAATHHVIRCQWKVVWVYFLKRRKFTLLLHRWKKSFWFLNLTFFRIAIINK